MCYKPAIGSILYSQSAAPLECGATNVSYQGQRSRSNVLSRVHRNTFCYQVTSIDQ